MELGASPSCDWRIESQFECDCCFAATVSFLFLDTENTLVANDIREALQDLEARWVRE